MPVWAPASPTEPAGTRVRGTAQPRHLNGRVDGAEIGKPREKSEHEHPVGHGTVAAHDLGRLELHGLGDGGEVGPIRPAVGHIDLENRAFWWRGTRSTAAGVGNQALHLSRLGAFRRQWTATEVSAGTTSRTPAHRWSAIHVAAIKDARRCVGVHARLERDEPRVVAEPGSASESTPSARQSVGGRSGLG